MCALDLVMSHSPQVKEEADVTTAVNLCCLCRLSVTILL